MTDSKPNLKARTLHEIARFATMFAYLWAMFLLFQIHLYVVLAQHHIPFTQFGVGFLNALVLAKVMLVADDSHGLHLTMFFQNLVSSGSKQRMMIPCSRNACKKDSKYRPWYIVQFINSPSASKLKWSNVISF